MSKFLDTTDLNNKPIRRVTLSTEELSDALYSIGYDSDPGRVSGKDKGICWRDSLGFSQSLYTTSLSELASLVDDFDLGDFTFTSSKGFFSIDDLVSRAFVETYVSENAGGFSGTLDQIAAPVASVSTNGQQFTNAPTPTASHHLANKGYVDAKAQGLNQKQSVRAAVSSAFTAYTSSGSGATKTLTASTNGVLNFGGLSSGWVDIDNDSGSRDPFLPNTASRVLIIDALTPQENGVYSVKDKGSVSTPWKLIRSSDCDGVGGDLSGGVYVFVTSGTLASSSWSLVYDGLITVDTDAINFTEFNAAGTLSFNAGIKQDGDNISLENTPGTNTLVINADDISVNTSVIARRATGSFTGNDIITDFEVNHNFGFQWVIAEAINGTTKNSEEVQAERTNTNKVTFKFSTPPATGLVYYFLILG